MEKLVLSVPEAAKLLGISAPLAYALAKSEGFPTIVVGKRLLVSAKGLERWIEKQSEIGWMPKQGREVK